jgi:hypothetical protein
MLKNSELFQIYLMNQFEYNNVIIIQYTKLNYET